MSQEESNGAKRKKVKLRGVKRSKDETDIMVTEMRFRDVRRGLGPTSSNMHRT
jgi:hypothetical protein